MSKKEDNLFKALGDFIEAMRLFIFSELEVKHGESWEKEYRDSLFPNQQEHWDRNLQEGQNPIQLIDYGNLKSFAINQKTFFREYFGRETNQLPTIFNQIAEARNILAHHSSFDDDKAEKAYLHMIEIAKKLRMNELEASLRKLKNESNNTISSVTNRKEPTISNRPNTGISKKDAINMVNNELRNNTLSNVNTVYSNINKAAPCWWLNIPPEKFNHSLNILLVSEDELIWINLPKGSCYPPESIFNTRNDNGKVDLRIGLEGIDYLKDYLSANNFDFNPYIKKRFTI